MSPRAPGLRLPRSWLALLVATGLVSGMAGGAAVAWLEAGPETTTVAGGAPVAIDAVPLNRLTVAPLVARVAPAVVNVAVLQASPYAQNPLLRDPYYRFFLGVPMRLWRRGSRQARGSWSTPHAGWWSRTTMSSRTPEP